MAALETGEASPIVCSSITRNDFQVCVCAGSSSRLQDPEAPLFDFREEGKLHTSHAKKADVPSLSIHCYTLKISVDRAKNAPCGKSTSCTFVCGLCLGL